MSQRKKLSKGIVRKNTSEPLIKIPTKLKEDITESIPDSTTLDALGVKDQTELELSGILMISNDINKETLERIYRRMLILHFDEKFTDSIQLIINSAGGCCDAGWALIDLMSYVKNTVRTVAMGEICSMATDIFIAGDVRIISPHCSSMIHQFSSCGEGTFDDLIASKKAWEMEMKKEVAHLIRCSKYNTKEQINKHLLKNYDVWLSPEDMKKHGLCDKIIKLTPRGKKII